MSLRLVNTPADLVAFFRARKTELGLTYSEMDHRAGLADGHCSKILNAKKCPTAQTIMRICRALHMANVMLAPPPPAPDRK